MCAPRQYLLFMVLRLLRKQECDVLLLSDCLRQRSIDKTSLYRRDALVFSAS